MFWRALLAFLALPGLVAFAIPLLVAWQLGGLHVRQPWGLALVAVGTLVLAWCVRDFYVQGRGTLAPWSPPRRLITDGAYRYSRNPMYVGVVGIVAGWAVAFASVALAAFAVLLVAGFHVRVVHGEEPGLARRHGAAWEGYARRVPRWIGPRRSPTPRRARR